ncbi:sigma 54-interacting transcriptional regulator [Brevibacillus reuszeri]|uniref:sigma 54-interacting transcriptional regulator n=1 Tax=Brevibacillus reuszeri TaxID=54915 RepID=UPI001FD1523C|nr:sigma 54-interacting transcriptional regulator [Brevibacillus reuszeri]
MQKMMQPITTYLRPTDTLEDAARVMLETQMDMLPVGDAQGKLVGVFSHRELYRMILEKASSTTAIESYMSTESITISREQNCGTTVDKVDSGKGMSQIGARLLVDKIDQANRQADKTLQKHFPQALYHWEHILTVDKAMLNLISSAQKVARRNTAVMIRGESGTGKELFAHAIHHASSRASGPFVTINCASVPEHLLEAEFFGYENGAFTGADRAGRIGKLELAHGGTLFLDEIGDMAMHLQAKLLRVIEGKEFFRIGGTKSIQTDVRIISATNAPLEELIQQKMFREELYYRLHVITCSIPPLRARKSDIPILTDAFIKQLNPILETTITGVENSVEKLFEQYEWPGNIRQLRNVIECGMIMAETGRISIADLPEELLKKADEGDRITLDQAAEKTELERTLRQTNGNKSQAARMLGISRSGFYEKLKKYQL